MVGVLFQSTMFVCHLMSRIDVNHITFFFCRFVSRIPEVGIRIMDSIRWLGSTRPKININKATIFKTQSIQVLASITLCPTSMIQQNTNSVFRSDAHCILEQCLPFRFCRNMSSLWANIRTKGVIPNIIILVLIQEIFSMSSNSRAFGIISGRKFIVQIARQPFLRS